MALAVESGLIEGARAGGAGLDRLIEAVWPEAYKIALTILHDAGLAEDAAQEACAAMVRSLATLKDDGAFAAWCYKIIVNAAITAVRRRPRTQALDARADREIHPDQSDALDLYRALAALPVVQRAVILLHYYAGLNSAEIADATGLPRSTIRFHLMLARRTLRKALAASDARSTRLSEEALSNVR